jgi:two-component system, cell cycle response regulator DivK
VDTERATVLIVEDNEQNMELTSFLLEEAGYRVVQAASPIQATEEIAREQPDLVLMDMDLGGHDGLSFVAELRSEPENRFPIVALTAHAMRGDRERFLKGGCNGYISKPISTRTFVADVAAYLAAGGEGLA